MKKEYIINGVHCTVDEWYNVSVDEGQDVDSENLEWQLFLMAMEQLQDEKYKDKINYYKDQVTKSIPI